MRLIRHGCGLLHLFMFFGVAHALAREDTYDAVKRPGLSVSRKLNSIKVYMRFEIAA